MPESDSFWFWSVLNSKSLRFAEKIQEGNYWGAFQLRAPGLARFKARVSALINSVRASIDWRGQMAWALEAS